MLPCTRNDFLRVYFYTILWYIVEVETIEVQNLPTEVGGRMGNMVKVQRSPPPTIFLIYFNTFSLILQYYLAWSV